MSPEATRSVEEDDPLIGRSVIQSRVLQSQMYLTKTISIKQIVGPSTEVTVLFQNNPVIIITTKHS